MDTATHFFGLSSSVLFVWFTPTISSSPGEYGKTKEQGFEFRIQIIGGSSRYLNNNSYIRNNEDQYNPTPFYYTFVNLFNGLYYDPFLVATVQAQGHDVIKVDARMHSFRTASVLGRSS